uniref:Sugar transporter SWEET1 n=1 Tax=Amphora coffeiformis TaxID=265554 RepID=A0A7S3L1Q6_9STRA
MLGNTLGWVSYGLLRSNWFIFFANAPGFFLSIFFNTTAIKLLYLAATLQSNDAATTATTPTTTLETTAALLEHKEPDTDKTIHNDKIFDNLPTPSAPLTDPSTSIVVEVPAPATPPAAAAMIGVSTSILAPAAKRLESHERLVLALMLVWMGVLSCVIAAKSWDDDLRQMVLGLTVNCNLVFFYGAPLSTIRQVLTTRSSRWLHGPTMLRNTANGVFWTVYGLAVLDPYVAVPNGLGALLGFVQMILWVVFPRAKDKTEQHASVEDATAAMVTEP